MMVSTEADLEECDEDEMGEHKGNEPRRFDVGVTLDVGDSDLL